MRLHAWVSALVSSGLRVCALKSRHTFVRVREHFFIPLLTCLS